MNEEYRTIAGYEGLYEVSDKGNVRSIYDGRHNIHRIKVLKLVENCHGYLVVCLCKNGKHKNFYVHRLVAKSFIPNPENHPHINHKDENKKNNSLKNLEWCSCEYNTNYGSRNKRVAEKLGRPVLQISKSGEIIKEFPSTKEAERETGVNRRGISSCCHGKLKSSGGFVWKYK